MTSAADLGGVDMRGHEPEVRRAWLAFYADAYRKYGITAQQYRDLYVAQHGCCYICRKAKGKNPDDPKGRGGRRLGVDHNHVTGAVRGLLCSGSTSANTCNRLIARYSVEALERAVEYVRTEPAQVVLAWGAEDLGMSAREHDEALRGILGLA